MYSVSWIRLHWLRTVEAMTGLYRSGTTKQELERRSSNEHREHAEDLRRDYGRGDGEREACVGFDSNLLTNAVKFSISATDYSFIT